MNSRSNEFPEPIMTSNKSAPVAPPSYDDVLRQAQDEGLQGTAPGGMAPGVMGDGVEGATRLPPQPQPQAQPQMMVQAPMQELPQYMPQYTQPRGPPPPHRNRFQALLKYKNLLLVAAIVFAMLSWVLPRAQAYAPQMFAGAAKLPPLAIAAVALGSGAVYRLADDMLL